jgi:uncharacterized membrane protein YedE/YeeE
MDSFTPVTASLGGILIGLAAVILMATNGRISGISGVFSGTIFGQAGDRIWRVFFVTGLVVAPVIYAAISGQAPAFQMDASWPLIVAGGLLVGFGTRLGSGCTSGHGVCGLSRLSLRSLTAVILFMAAGMLVVVLVRAGSGL